MMFRVRTGEAKVRGCALLQRPDCEAGQTEETGTGQTHLPSVFWKWFVADVAIHLDLLEAKNTREGQ